MKRKNSKLSNETPPKRKFVFVTIKNIKIKLDTGSDIAINNEKTWKKTGKTKFIDFARGVAGRN